MPVSLEQERIAPFRYQLVIAVAKESWRFRSGGSGRTGGCYPFHNPTSLRFKRNKVSEPVSQMRGLVLFSQVFIFRA